MFYLLPPNQLALEKGEAVPNYLATHGIAMFVVLISTELAIGYACSKKCVYRFNDFIGSLSSGTCQQLVGTLTSRLLNPKGSFTVVQSKYSLMTLNVKARPIQSWLLLMMGVDLAYYWAHRCLHVFHLGWAAHSVHHSGEDYNLPTALRQGALQPLMTWIFSLPLALFFPAESILVHLQLNTLYQFWIHTEFCGRLGWLEFLFNTPFHHRVHHRPPGNCNYAGVLIVWDRLFKTYSTETERLDHYGLAQAVRSFNVWELNLQHWRKIAGSSRGFQGVGLWRLIRASLGHRAHHPMRFSPQALLDPFDPMKNGSWALPKEATGKYQGADLTLLGKTAALTVFLGSFLCLQRAERKNVELMQLCCNVGAGLLWLGALGDMLDQGTCNRSLMLKMFTAASVTLGDFALTAGV